MRKKAEMQKSFERDAVDITLDGAPVKFGNLHPLNIVRNQIIDAFVGMGFEVFEGSEIETDYYCFQLVLTVIIQHFLTKPERLVSL